MFESTDIDDAGFLKDVFDALEEVFFVFTPEGDIRQWNRRVREVTGYSDEEIAEMHPADFVPVDEVSRVERGIQTTLEEGRVRLEAAFLTKSGERIPYEFTGRLLDRDGEVLICGTGRNIVERKQYRDQFQLLVEEVEDYAIFMLDPQGRIVTWNEGAQKIKGFEREEVLGKHLSVLYPPEAREANRAQELLDRAVREGQVETEGWRARSDGTRFWARATLTALRDEREDLQGFAKVTRDLTEERERKQRLRESEERYRRLFEESRDAVILTTPEGSILDVNTAAEELFGYSEEELLEMNAADLYAHPEERAERIVPELLSGDPSSILEAEMCHSDGSVFLASASVTVHRDDRGTPELIQALVRDISRQRRLEQQLLEIQEAERRRIGQELHDGIASQLTGIIMMGETLSTTLEDGGEIAPSDLRELTELVRESAQQTRLLSRGLNPVQLGEEGLSAALGKLAERTEKQFELSCTFQGDVTALDLGETEAAHLYRIAQEAVNNAVKHAEARSVQISLSAGDETVELSVTDDGKGFSTTGPEDDAGLGLHTMRYRADLIGGRLEIDERSDEGTLVHCRMPRPQQA